MAKQTIRPIAQENPGMIFVLSIAIVAIVNFLVLWLANMWFPMNIVLGNVSMSAPWAAALFGTALSVITVLVTPFVTWREQHMKRNMTPAEMMALFFVVNFVAVWLLTRKSEVFGVGVTSWIVVLALAVVFDFLQGMVMMQVEKWRTKA